MVVIRRYDYGQARDAFYETFKTAWDDVTLGWQSISGLASEPTVYYENVQESGEGADISSAHVRIFARHVGGEQDSFGEDGEGGFEAVGFITIQVFTPQDQVGLTLSDALCKVIARAYRGKTGNGDNVGIVYRRVRVNEVGQSERWFQANVNIDFEYDEDNG